MLRAFVLSLLVLGVAVAQPITAHAQDTSARFEILTPSDTSFVFVLAGAQWIKVGMTGFVVDPRQKDVMVARFAVRSIDERSAVATVTSMTSGITTFHVAVMPIPRKPWYRQKGFLFGAVLGLAAGFFAGRA